VADLPGAAAPVPGLAVEDQAAADAGAPEDAEQRAVGRPAAEHELGVGRDADVVAERDLRAERRLQRRGERETGVPAGQVVGARDGSGRVSTLPGEPTPTPRSCAGSSLAALAASVSAAAIALATSAGPPVVGVGWRALPSTRCSASVTTASIFVPPRSMPPTASVLAGSGFGSCITFRLLPARS
jgi:hypothetical protein